MKEASLTNASTIALIVHGVGDHSGGHIIEKATKGFERLGWNDVKAEKVRIPGLPELESPLNPAVGLQITADAQTHFLVPIVWSRLRPRAANEAEVIRRNVLDQLFQAFFLVFPALGNALACVPAAPWLLPRVLVTIIATSFAVCIPAVLLTGYFLITRLVMQRYLLDMTHYHWWRILVLLVIVEILGWLVAKMLMAIDFIGDVVSYVGSAKYRQGAEDRLLGALGKLALAAPRAQILILGHSLGSILATHSIIKIDGSGEFGDRLRLLTMGSPLRLLSWFFPTRVMTPEKLLTRLEQRHLVNSWVNMWRDADVIGRALKVTGDVRFAETSLGNGTHTDYWADARCWQAVVNYLRALTDQSLDHLMAEWNRTDLSEQERQEFLAMRSARQAVFGLWWTFIIIVAFLVDDKRVHLRERLEALHGTTKAAIYALSGAIWILLVIWYVFTTQPTGLGAASAREMLARARFNWFIGTSCVKIVFAILFALGLALMLWESLTA